MVMRQQSPVNETHVPMTSTMDRDELAGHIRRVGIWTIAELFDNAAAQVIMGLRDGINIFGWEARAVLGIIRFARWNDGHGTAMQLPDEGVLYINSDNPTIVARYASIETPYPLVIVTKREGKGGDVSQKKLAMLRARYGVRET